MEAPGGADATASAVTVTHCVPELQALKGAVAFVELGTARERIERR